MLLIVEFIPYVFQILSLMLEMHEEKIPESYAELYSFLLAPVLWERMGNIPPLVRLLRAYIEKGGEQIYAKLVWVLLFICRCLKHLFYIAFFILKSIDRRCVYTRQFFTGQCEQFCAFKSRSLRVADLLQCIKKPAVICSSA